MLDRKIQIMADLRLFLHHLNQIRIDFFRITVQQTDPLDTINLTKFPKQTM